MLDLKEERGDAGLEPRRKLQRVLSYQRRAEGGAKGSHCCLPAPASSWQWEALPGEEPENCSFSQVGGGKKKKMVRAIPKSVKILLASFRKTMGRKTFSFASSSPLPSLPIDIQVEVQTSCQSSLDGSSPLQQDFCCLNK